MSDSHLNASEAEQYILGALEPALERKLEAHTLVCDACARLLQQEAILEEQLREVAHTASLPENVVRPARWSVRRVAAVALGPCLAAAAALALMLSHPAQVSQPVEPEPMAVELPVSPPPGMVACPDLPSQDSCAQSAAARGLLVQYPVGMGEVPRYEGNVGLPAGALRSRPASL
jgi:hypothetical protein